MVKLIKPPSRWGREPRCAGFAMLVGAALGTLLGWWLSTPLTPWLEFKYLTATYRLGAHEIQIAGVYRVNQECDGYATPVWRTELITGDGPIQTYAPFPKIPPLTEGAHSYTLPLVQIQPVDPADWLVRVTVSCATLMPDPIISPSVVVTILDLIEQNAPPWTRTQGPH